jgi:23S rRNA pseudouridine2605 synthase
MPTKPRPKRRRPPKAPRTDAVRPAADQRLQKVLAAAGIASRRQCEELIAAGRIQIDRQVVTKLGTKVDAARQEVRVDGVPLPKPKRLYLAVNKPPGVVSTNRDPSGRPRVVDLVPADGARLFCVGRLDLHSEGLILLTNDGELANRLTHPRYGVRKTYRVQVAGQPTPQVLARLRRGVRLGEGLARVEQIRVKSRQKESTSLEMVLREGRNREIRRLLARVGHKVLRLTRIAVGPVRLGSLPSGAYRRLTNKELDALRQASERT